MFGPCCFMQSLWRARALPTQLRSPRVRFVRALFTIMSSWAAVYVYLYILLATYRQFVLLDVLQLYTHNNVGLVPD